MRSFNFELLGSIALGICSALATNTTSACKCIPSEACWPSPQSWAALNSSVSGKLIKTIPVAAPCYAGPDFNNATCENVVARWTDPVFQADQPIGYDYPIYSQSCDIPGGNTTVCSIGTSPVYAINATSPKDVATGVNFARENNLRLVIKTTGHDLIGRSTGFGSLEIWLRHLRNGVTFHENYKSNDTYQGAVIEVGGGYSWSDVYPVAQANNVVVVGGGCPSVSAIGGYMQGGGHSLADRQFGLAADQLLEALVVLANGSIVTASARQNTELFTAIRGGGGGTYGIVVSGIIKAYPEATIAAQVLEIAPLSPGNIPEFLEALAILYEALPYLSDQGLSGFGSWAAYSPTPVVGNYTSGVQLALGAFNQSTSQVEAVFAATAAKLKQYNGTLFISTTYLAFDNYFDYYYALNGVNSAAESEGALVSRLLGKEHLHNSTGLRTMLNITAGLPNEFTFCSFGLIGGGAVLNNSDPYSGVNPVWRKTYVLNSVARGWTDTTDYATTVAIHHDITYVKGAAMTRLAPDMGSYMNEGDGQDPNYLVNYYGGALPQHEAAKSKYDPDGVFYCPTCVGSEDWSLSAEGRLCRI